MVQHLTQGCCGTADRFFIFHTALDAAGKTLARQFRPLCFSSKKQLSPHAPNFDAASLRLKN
jgi:hypothetical protein